MATVEPDPDAYQRLKQLQKDLETQGIPEKVKLTDIASALMMYTTPQQAAGMLLAFIRHRKARDDAKQTSEG